MKLYMHHYTGNTCSFSVNPETDGLSPLYKGTTCVPLSSEWTLIPYEHGDQDATAYARMGQDAPEVYTVVGWDTLHLDQEDLIHTYKDGQQFVVRRGNEDVEGLLSGVLQQIVKLDETSSYLVDRAFIEMAIRLRPEFESQLKEFSRAVNVMGSYPGKLYQASVLHSLMGIRAERPLKEAEKALLEMDRYIISIGGTEVSGTELALAGFLEIWKDFRDNRYSSLSTSIVRVDDYNLKDLIKVFKL